MGTYVEYLGEMDIPEERRAEFASQALKLLRAGGMMSLDEVHLYGKRLWLLYPPELDEKGRARGCYNYFENDAWEYWHLDANGGTFYSEKVGHREFCRTVLAATVLLSLHCSSFGVATVEGRVIREHDLIGWMNGVLGTRYTNQRVTRPDLMQRLLRREGVCLHQGLLLFPLEDVPAECIDREAFVAYLADCEFPDRDEVAKPPSGEEMEAYLRDGTLPPDRSSMDYFAEPLRQFRENGGTLEQVEAWLQMTPEQREAVYLADPNDPLPLLYNRNPNAAAVAQTARALGGDFWEVWDRISDKIPDRKTAPRPQPCPPVEPISTQDFLGLDPDDMAYDWQPNGPISFSGEMRSWMAELRRELDAMTDELPPGEFLRVFVENSARAGGMVFREMFYEFIARQTERRVQSAVLLLGRLAERQDPHLRRYLAILGNPALRERVFGF